jgi:alpha-tubulin suppressor-like RCC1 family protein
MRFLIVALVGLLVTLLPAGAQVQTIFAAGRYHYIQINGNVVSSWGKNFYGQLGQGDNTNKPTPQPVTLAPTQSGNPVSVCAGYRHSCVLDDESNLACTGRDKWVWYVYNIWYMLIVSTRTDLTIDIKVSVMPNRADNYMVRRNSDVFVMLCKLMQHGRSVWYLHWKLCM